MKSFNKNKFNKTSENDDGVHSKLFVNIRSNSSPKDSNLGRTNIGDSKRISIASLIAYIKDNMDVINNPKLEKTEEEENVLPLEVNDDTQFVALQQNSVRHISKLPANLDNIFSKFLPDMSRIGVMKYSLSSNKGDKNKISLLSSVLSCVKDDFILQSSQVQQVYVSQLNNNLVGMVNSDKYTDFGYKKLGFKQNELISQIKGYQNTDIILRVIADYFHINIFLLNISMDQVLVANNSNTFKKNILLILLNQNSTNGTNADDDSFEPVFYKNGKIFDADSDIITYLHENKYYHNLIDSPEPDNELASDVLDSQKKISCANDLEKSLVNPTKKTKTINYSVRERQMLRLLNNSKDINKSDSVVQPKQQIACVVQDKNKPLENNVEGMNEINECSESCDKNIPDLSEPEAEEDEEVKNQKENKDSTDEGSDMMPQFLANDEKLKNYNPKQKIIQALKQKKYNEKKNTLGDLQKDAELLGIPITFVGKNGKAKNKTKHELIEEIQKSLKQ